MALKQKELITTHNEQEGWDYVTTHSLTESAENWILENRDRIDLTKEVDIAF